MTQQIVEIKLTSLAHDGRAVGRINGEGPRQQVAFVQGALPGQRVRAQIIKAKKSFVEAVCIEVLQDMPEAVKSPCPHAHECGGCPLQSMPYDQQLFWKQSMLKEALQRIGKVQDVNLKTIHPSPLLFGYRNKMEFAVGKDDNNQLILGLRAKASHKIIPTPNCMLMPKECTIILQKISELMAETGLEPWQEIESHENYANTTKGLWRHVILRMPHAKNINNGCHVQIITAQTNAQNQSTIAKLGQKLLDLNIAVSGFVHEERKSSTLYAQGEVCITKLGQKYLYEQLANIQYALDYSSFFQVNTQAAELLCHEVEAMLKLSGSEIIWDIYCGVGAPALALAREAKELYGVEANAKAINMAKLNAKNLGFTHCHYQAGIAEKVITNPKSTWPKPDIIILDPPRAGMHINVVKAILKAKPKRIVYISCNPSTLARDIGLLSQDYTLDCINAVDLFPHTAHVESCSLLTKK